MITSTGSASSRSPRAGRIATTCLATALLAIPLVGGAAASGASASDAGAPSTTDGAIPAPVASEATTTLPLLGVQLTVDVATTPDGTLASVAVNPAQGLTATKVRPNTVAFVDEDGTSRVRVRSRHGGQKVDVEATSLAGITGPGSWTGDVFGTGSTTTVSFQITVQGDGSPDIAAVTTTDPTATVAAVGHDDGEHARRARVAVRFVSGGQARALWITASTWTSDDGQARAASSVTLSEIKGIGLPADQVVGDHVWTGTLCDGTTAKVPYAVAADGSITAGAITPAIGTAKADGTSLKVSFSDHEGVRIRVSSNDGGLRISAEPRLRCDAVAPTVNTPVDTPASDGQHRDSDHGGGEQGDPKTTDPKTTDGSGDRRSPGSRA